MAKPSKEGALAAGREAENRYRTALEPLLPDYMAGKVDKSRAVMITKARAEADKKMELDLHLCLK
jgi:hypothetical protein